MTLFPLLCLILAEFYKNVQTKVMVDRCCQHKEAALVKLKQQQAKVLWIVLAINLAISTVEFGSGLRAAALSLTGDSLDMLGDALVYGTSLYVIYCSTKAQAGAVLLKGVIMFGFAIAVCARAVYQFLTGVSPTAEIMEFVCLLALLANLIFLLLLTKGLSSFNGQALMLKAVQPLAKFKKRAR